MGGILDRLDFPGESGGGPTVGRSRAAVAEVIDRLERGESAVEVVGALGIEPADLIAVLAFAGLGPDDEANLGPTLVRVAPGRPGLVASASEPGLAAILPGVDRRSRLGLAAGLLQVLDAWDASHDAAQIADDLGDRGDSAFWHGIGHRREPDAGNAAYWLRRLGQHPAFGAIGAAIRPIVAVSGEWNGTKDGRWDPSAMVALAGRARPGSGAEVLARRIQRVEMRELLDHQARSIGLA